MVTVALLVLVVSAALLVPVVSASLLVLVVTPSLLVLVVSTALLVLIIVGETLDTSEVGPFKQVHALEIREGVAEYAVR